jgi:hypothetical protein
MTIHIRGFIQTFQLKGGGLKLALWVQITHLTETRREFKRY